MLARPVLKQKANILVSFGRIKCFSITGFFAHRNEWMYNDFGKCSHSKDIRGWKERERKMGIAYCWSNERYFFHISAVFWIATQIYMHWIDRLDFLRRCAIGLFLFPIFLAHMDHQHNVVKVYARFSVCSFFANQMCVTCMLKAHVCFKTRFFLCQVRIHALPNRCETICSQVQNNLARNAGNGVVRPWPKADEAKLNDAKFQLFHNKTIFSSSHFWEKH